jgi:protease IV
MVEDAKRWFFGLVSERRKVTVEAVPGLTTGRIYSGRQAVDLKLADQIGDEKAAVSWLEKERKLSPGLKIVDWKPESESTGFFGWLSYSLAAAIGVSGDAVASLVNQISTTLKLDGLVSVWHPARN